MPDSTRGRNGPGAEITLSDPSELGSLRRWLERVSGVEVEQVPGTPGPGEQGALDALMLLAGSGGLLTIAIKTLPEFIRSRRSDVEIALKIEGREITVNARNVDDVMPIIDKILKD